MNEQWEEYSRKASAISRFLTCPHCQGALELNEDGTNISCAKCDSQMAFKDNVVIAMGPLDGFVFDEKYEVMNSNNDLEDINALCYDKQCEYLESLLSDDTVLLDVGCGPRVQYTKPAGCFSIGVDPSFNSLKVNQSLDLAVLTSADNLPIQSDSVDVIACFYSVHHMIGSSMAESRKVLEGAFQEFARVLKDGGRLIIFEMVPYKLLWLAERLMWDKVKKKFQQHPSMLFWDKKVIEKCGQRHFSGAPMEFLKFNASPFLFFPPVFELPWFQIPNFLYPLEPKAYQWRV